MPVIPKSHSVLDSSTSTGDEESVTAEGPFWVRVYGWNGATNAYSIIVQ